MKPPILVQGISHPGAVRERNEDAFAILPEQGHGLLLLVCDGMGGMGRGDEASRLAVSTIAASVGGQQTPPSQRLTDAIRVADAEVREALCTGHQGRAGSTAVMVYVEGDVAHVAWVGDSRAYLLRDGAVTARTRDHKLVQELVDAGELTPEQARNSPMANVVTRALGGRKPSAKAVEPEVLHIPWQLQAGDRLVLCSDGVCDLVEDGELWKLVAVEPEVATQNLVAIALERGGHDNITAIVAHFTGEGEQPADYAYVAPVYGGSATTEPPTPAAPVADTLEPVEDDPSDEGVDEPTQPMSRKGNKDTAVLAPLSAEERAALKAAHRAEQAPAEPSNHVVIKSDPGSPALAVTVAALVAAGVAVFAGVLG